MILRVNQPVEFGLGLTGIGKPWDFADPGCRALDSRVLNYRNSSVRTIPATPAIEGID